MDPNAREKKCGVVNALKGDIVSKEALQGCPNHSAVRTDDAAASLLFGTRQVQGLGVERREEVAFLEKNVPVRGMRRPRPSGTTGTQMEAVPRTDVVSLGHKNISCKAKRIPWATIGPAPSENPTEESAEARLPEPWSPASKIWKAASTPDVVHIPAHQRHAPPAGWLPDHRFRRGTAN